MIPKVLKDFTGSLSAKNEHVFDRKQNKYEEQRSNSVQCVAFYNSLLSFENDFVGSCLRNYNIAISWAKSFPQCELTMLCSG